MFNLFHHHAWIAAGAAAIALLAGGVATASLAIDGQPEAVNSSVGMLQIDLVQSRPGQDR